jgi:hypothetical protein
MYMYIVHRSNYMYRYMILTLHGIGTLNAVYSIHVKQFILSLAY